MSQLPGAFPEDDDVPVPVPRREMAALSAKGQRELERKRKVAEKATEFAEKWERWKGYSGEQWSQTVIKPEDGDDTGPNPRIPPGNHNSRRFQIMDLDFMPEVDILDWKLSVTSDLGTINLTLDDIRELGETNYTADFHWSAFALLYLTIRLLTSLHGSVTKWSHLDVKWTGVPFKKVMERCHSVIPAGWKYMLESSADGYTTNIVSFPGCRTSSYLSYVIVASPLQRRRDIERDDVYLVYGLNGQIPIPLEHGTVRVIKPHLYAWKSAKWLERIDFVMEDQPGFWEVRGFHMRANAWAQERYGAPNDEIQEVLPPELEKRPTVST